MDKESIIEAWQAKSALMQERGFEEALAFLARQPKRQYTEQEIEEARGNLALMNDRVFLGTFADNKNNHIITEIVNALRKIHAAGNMPPIERTTVQNVSLIDVFGRGMAGDLLGEGYLINIAVEVQKGSQEGYAVRGTITSGNAMRIQFNPGDAFTEAPDVIGVNILGFRLPELKNRGMFCSRIVRAEYESKETFLADKYSDYYIELPKMDDFAKDKLPKEYHDLWDLCCIFRAKVKELEEVIKMQAITNATALELSNEVKKAVAPKELVNATLDREDEYEQIRIYFEQYKKYMERQAKKAAEEAAKKAAEEAAKKAAEEAAKAAEEAKKAAEEAAKNTEKILVLAISNFVPQEVIEAMRQSAGITESRLEELKKQAQMA